MCKAHELGIRSDQKFCTMAIIMHDGQYIICNDFDKFGSREWLQVGKAHPKKNNKKKTKTIN